MFLILVSSSYFGFHAWNDGYRAGTGETIGAYLLPLWVNCWMVSSWTKNGTFVRWVMLGAALVVVPAATVGAWMATDFLGILVNLGLLVGAPFVAGVYHFAYSRTRGASVTEY